MSSIDVIIATYNARATVERAVASALACRHVRRVIVSDDASTDATPDLVEQAFAGRGEVLVLRGEVNAGPAAVRNRALAVVEADHFAILDSDDFFLMERFDGIFDGEPFDLWADNIVFTNDPDSLPADVAQPGGGVIRRTVDTAAFVRGNYNNFRQRRHQLGFVKPVFRTAFLAEHAIRYDESLRLGEDFILLMDLLEAGARFTLTSRCGYVAIERVDSLSARHGLRDLENLLAAERRVRARIGRGAAASAFAKRYRQTRCKYNYMRALDARRSGGLVSGVRAIGGLPPTDAFDVLAAVSADKMRTALRKFQGSDERFRYYLM